MLFSQATTISQVSLPLASVSTATRSVSALPGHTLSMVMPPATTSPFSSARACAVAHPSPQPEAAPGATLPANSRSMVVPPCIYVSDANIFPSAVYPDRQLPWCIQRVYREMFVLPKTSSYNRATTVLLCAR